MAPFDDAAHLALEFVAYRPLDLAAVLEAQQLRLGQRVVQLEVPRLEFIEHRAEYFTQEFSFADLIQMNFFLLNGR
jgi:hypothetical protein